MREIKFRAWDTVNKSMITSPMAMTSSWVLFTEEIEGPDYGRAIHDLEQYQIMQYTGLHDKQGKEIYEGDIVSYLDMNLTIAWSDTLVRPILRPYTIAHHYDLNTDVAKECEVIGNIYENPELMPKESN